MVKVAWEESNIGSVKYAYKKKVSIARVEFCCDEFYWYSEAGK